MDNNNVQNSTENEVQSNEAPKPEKRKRRFSSGVEGSVLGGLLMIVLGIVLTAISYATNAYEYTVYWGLMLVGVVVLIAGIIEKFR